ncbi:MAG: hypothetical protein KBD85_01525 [Elusimicrobia bacterium]|nr:hypothetical protein [Elusimicrobiota bacterium]
MNSKIAVPSSDSWTHWIEILVGFAGSIVFVVSCNHLPFGHYVDDIKWVLLAESFLQGSVLTSWSSIPMANTSITWGFGFLLTPVVWLFGRQELVFKIYSSMLMVAGLGFFYFSVRRLMDSGGRILLLVGLGGVSYVTSFSGNVISESGYVLMWGLICFFLSRVEAGILEPKRAFLIGVFMGFLFLIRNIGGLVAISVAGMGLTFFRKRIFLPFTVGGLITSIPVSLYIKSASGTWSFYAPYWKMGASRGVGFYAELISNNLYYYWKGLTCMTFVNLPELMPSNSFLKSIFVVLGFVVMGRGLFLLKEKLFGRWLIVYILGYLVVLGFWSYQAPRYLLPAYPAFMALVGMGVQGLWKKTLTRWALIGAVCLSVRSNGPEIASLLKKSVSQPVLIPHTSEMWLRDNSTPDDVIVSMDIARIYYLAGRRGVPFIPSHDVASFVEGAKKNGVTLFHFRENNYVGAAPGMSDPIAAQHSLLRDYLFQSKLFEPVYSNPTEKTTFFRIKSIPAVL